MSRPSKKSLAYYFRNFFHIVPFVIVPAILLGYSVASSEKVNLIIDIFQGDFSKANTFASIFSTFTIVRYISSWWVTLLGFLTAILAIDVLIYKIDRHMHLGLMSNRNLFKVAFSGYGVTLIFLLTLILIYELFNFLVVGIVYFIAPVINNVALGVLLVVMVLICDIFIAYLIAMLICTLPAIHSERFSLNVAMSYSIRLMRKQYKVIINTILYFLISKFIVFTLLYFITDFYAQWAINSLYYFVWLGFLPCFACRTYIRVNNDERHDLFPIKQYNNR